MEDVKKLFVFISFIVHRRVHRVLVKGGQDLARIFFAHPLALKMLLFFTKSTMFMSPM